MIDACYLKSIELLRNNSIPEGFVASSANDHYAAIWARDACISSIGANLTDNKKLLETSKTSLLTLAKLQAPLGQIPAVYWPKRNYWDWGEAGATDASAWFIIAVWQYLKATDDSKFLKKVYPAALKAFCWLTFQDANNFGLIDSPAAADWMDSTLNRCGKVMYVNALYYWVSLAMIELGKESGDNSLKIDTTAFKSKFNLLFWPSTGSDFSGLLEHVGYPSDAVTAFPHPCSIAAHREAARKRQFYLSHVSYGSFADVCDVLGNSLAVLLKLANRQQQSSILKYFAEKEVSQPYPAKCLAEPVTKACDRWEMLISNVEQLQAAQWRNPPFRYHNAAVWPFVGAFYAMAASSYGQTRLAEAELTRLAEANKLGKKGEWEFPEWIHGRTGKPAGAAYQSWNAATYIMAYKAIIEGSKIIP